MRIVITGYDHLKIDSKNLLVAQPIAAQVRSIVEQGTLYDFASCVPGALTLHGRAPVYVIPFGPNNERVAVRHAMRGGWIAKFLKDRFLPPTRVLRELMNAVRLHLMGIPTPNILALVTYPAGGIFRRADVMTQFIQDGIDLAAIFADARNDEQRRPILDAIATLLGKMAAGGVQHPDLNLKNILITAEESGYTAHVLDIDRVHFHVPNDPFVAQANLKRLTRSFQKWRARPGIRTNALPDSDIQYLTLATATLEPAVAIPTSIL
jgi:hypothetical protein